MGSRAGGTLTQVLQETPRGRALRNRGHNVLGLSDRSRVGISTAGEAAPALHVLEIFQPAHGGVPAYVEMIVRGLQAAGVRVSVACTPDAAAGRRLRALGVEAIEIQVGRAPQPLSDGLAISRLARYCR